MSDITNEVAKEIPKEGFSGDEYNHVAKNSELETIRLLSSKFIAEPDAGNGNDKLKLNYSRKIVACQYMREDSAVVAIFQYHVDGKRARKKAFSLVAEYGVSYTVPNDATEAAALGFCRNVGKFAAYPYFRGLAAHVFAEAGLRVPPLPAIASTAHIQKNAPAKVN
ncbi:hypothetical protein [Novosphingobium sp. KA1]|uniref:hypothetical protein n=1 Tax=Novosphingobium sp. (strain KA1) TaxID=164608 RepID=UPI001A8E9A03|nr:hypothetical protein [Novosphingobium sp. KA1]QSR15629.1 hypothetical protein CA833_00140 [Novosphingobium sp. KA1]